MRYNSNINNKANTSMLIDYLESAIADDMILNSFIRDIQIIDIIKNEVIILVTSKEALELLKHDYKNVFLQGVEQIFERKYGIKFILKGEEKYINGFDFDIVIPESKNISSKFTFNNYVKADFNREVVDISKKIIEFPGRFSPLFITSNSGLGKTHLLHSIGNHFLKNGLSSIYIEPNQFTRTISSLSKEGGNALSNYIDKITSYDLLLFDDIQNLVDRKVTLKVLFNIINSHIINEKQIIIVSDKKPKELSGFEDRFVTRFDSGLTTSIKQPSIDDLIKILEFKLKDQLIDPTKWEKEALRFIARNNSSSIRAIEGAVKRVAFYTMSDTNIKYTYTVISSIFKELSVDIKELTPKRIIERVGEYYKISPKEIISKSRKKDLVIARHICMYLIRSINKLSYSEIGKLIGGRDHSTVVIAVEKMERSMKVNSVLKKALDKIEKNIKINK